MTDIDEIMARLNPAVRDKVIKALDTTNKKQALPSVGMTRALGGGIGYGRQTTIWGNRSAGKTAFTLETVGKAQKDDVGCAWIDAEKNYDLEWSARLGVDNSQLMVSTVTAISDVADATADFLRAGVEFVAVDSISALLPNSFFDDKDEMKAMENTGQIGQFSRDMGTVAKMLNARNQHSALVFISQVRTNLGGYHASLKPMGGMAIEHFNSTSIKLWSNTSEDKQIKGEVRSGDIIFQHPVGREVVWFIDKNRGPGMGVRGEYNFFYAGDFVGIDVAGECVDLGVLAGKVEKKGTSWYTIYGEQFQGKNKAAAYLRDNPEVFMKLRDELGG